ncbi:MAG TPA: hypothetical protein DEF45_04620 [Rhodopirellula sp.]|nr:hypothetical protein [Rhodopirellula sp.]
MQNDAQYPRGYQKNTRMILPWSLHLFKPAKLFQSVHPPCVGTEAVIQRHSGKFRLMQSFAAYQNRQPK